MTRRGRVFDFFDKGAPERMPPLLWFRIGSACDRGGVDAVHGGLQGGVKFRV